VRSRHGRVGIRWQTAVAPAESAGPAAMAHPANPQTTNFVADTPYRDAIRGETSDVMWITFLTNL